MAETTGDDGRFGIVRRGYDIDQVDQFVLDQAAAWRTALQAAEERTRAAEQELTRLRALEASLEAERESLALDRQRLLAEVKVETERQREELAKIRADALDEASTAAAEYAERSLAEAKEKADGTARELQERRARMEAEFQATRADYELAEATLRAKVNDLNSMRLSLVTGLEAIAKGGLAGLGEIEDTVIKAGTAANGGDPRAAVDVADRG